jgi:hypothetical protein
LLDGTRPEFERELEMGEEAEDEATGEEEEVVEREVDGVDDLKGSEERDVEEVELWTSSEVEMEMRKIGDARRLLLSPTSPPTPFK